MKIIGIKLASLENVFQYESDDTSYVQYNQDFVLNFSVTVCFAICVCLHWNEGSKVHSFFLSKKHSFSFLTHVLSK
jgi:hypothetical protein